MTAFASLSLNKIADNIDLLVAVDNTRFESGNITDDGRKLLDVVSQTALDRFCVALNYATHELRDDTLIQRAAKRADLRRSERVQKIDRRKQMKALDAEIARMSAELNGTAFAY